MYTQIVVMSKLIVMIAFVGVISPFVCLRFGTLLPLSTLADYHYTNPTVFKVKTSSATKVIAVPTTQEPVATNPKSIGIFVITTAVIPVLEISTMLKHLADYT